MNFNCPFCSNPLKNLDHDVFLNYSCQNEVCQKESPQECARWTIDVNLEGDIIWYAARLKIKETNYVITSERYRPAPGSRLYYDAPDYGALIRVPMVEVACFLEPKEPLHECLVGYVEKLIGYIVFS
jgi:hypothetical protein